MHVCVDSCLLDIKIEETAVHNLFTVSFQLIRVRIKTVKCYSIIYNGTIMSAFCLSQMF